MRVCVGVAATPSCLQVEPTRKSWNQDAQRNKQHRSVQCGLRRTSFSARRGCACSAEPARTGQSVGTAVDDGSGAGAEGKEMSEDKVDLRAGLEEGREVDARRVERPRESVTKASGVGLSQRYSCPSSGLWKIESARVSFSAVQSKASGRFVRERSSAPTALESLSSTRAFRHASTPSLSSDVRPGKG